MSLRRFRAPGVGLALALSSVSVHGQGVAEFYRGKTVEITVGTGPGGGYDANARLLARHLGAFVPGAPNIVVNNMPGGGGIVAANYLYNAAPKDGLFLGAFSNAMLTEPLFGASTIKFDTRRFGWLGSLSREEGVCVASRSSGVGQWQMLQSRSLTVGTTAPGTTTYLFPLLLKRLLGAELKFVSGYTDGSQVALALERGEVDMLCQTFSSLRISRPDWISTGFVKPLVYIGLSPNSELPGTPAITELVNSEEARDILKIILAPVAAGRPFAAPPGIPVARLAALRQAFGALVRHPAFLEDARAARIEISPLQGAGMDELLGEIFTASPAALARVRSLISSNEGL